jgi:hypothetical protein
VVVEEGGGRRRGGGDRRRGGEGPPVGSTAGRLSSPPSPKRVLQVVAGMRGAWRHAAIAEDGGGSALHLGRQSRGRRLRRAPSRPAVAGAGGGGRRRRGRRGSIWGRRRGYGGVRAKGDEEGDDISWKLLVLFMWRTRQGAPQNALIRWRTWPCAPQK